MVILKVAPIFILILVVGADKKIELQDIEDDNLKSEKESEYDNTEQRSQISGPSPGPGFPSLDFLKHGFLRYFEGQAQPPQQSRYVQQYAVTEQPERTPVITPKAQYGPPVQQPIHQHQQQVQPQQAMVGYLSNVPMQIYLVPQYYSEGSEQGGHAQTAAQYTTGGGRVAGYPTAPEAVQPQNNYIEVPTYVTPTQKTYVPQYSSQPVTYVSIAPTVAPSPTIAPVLTYQLPVVQYNAGAVIAPQTSQKGYYPGHYPETNAVEEVQESIDESPKYSHTEVSYAKSPNEYRYYSNRPLPQSDYRHNHISELPHPNSLLLKPSPPHLSHIPKALPMYRPLNKPVYGTSPPHPPVPFHRPNEAYGPPKRRPTSLLDSYVPSSLQIEYMKRGYTNDPIVAYEALSSGRHFAHAPAPRHYERGFLPNQMYHTAAGGVTFGHYKRTPKLDKVSQ